MDADLADVNPKPTARLNRGLKKDQGRLEQQQNQRQNQSKGKTKSSGVALRQQKLAQGDKN